MKTTHRLTARISIKRSLEGTQLAKRSRSPSTSFDKRVTRSISDELLEDFNSIVKKLPSRISFAETRKLPFFRRFFWHSRGKENEIEVLFERARDPKSNLRTLYKTEDLRILIVPCSIRGYDFDDSLCNSGAGVRLISEILLEWMELQNMHPPWIRVGLADSLFTTPVGELTNVPVTIGNCIVPVDFQVAKLQN